MEDRDASCGVNIAGSWESQLALEPSWERKWYIPLSDKLLISRREWPSGKATDFDVCTKDRISVDRGFDPLLAFYLFKPYDPTHSLYHSPFHANMEARVAQW